MGNGTMMLAPSHQYAALARFSLRFHSLSHNVIHFILLSPLFLVLPMLLPKKSTLNDMTLYRDVGYGLPRAGSQQSRKFRMLVVYSNPLADLRANY